MQRRVSIRADGIRGMRHPKADPEYDTITLDLFVATRETWGYILALRTGPAEFSKRLVTLKSAGGCCPSHLKFRETRSGSSQAAAAAPGCACS